MLIRQPMPSAASILAQVLMIAPPLAQTALLWQLLRRKLLREYSIFAAYTALQVLKPIIARAIYGHEQGYFWFYWISELVDIPLVVAVLYQLYSRLFSGYEALRRFQDLVFRWSAAICVLVAVASAAAATGSDTNRLVAMVLAMDVAAAVLKVGLIVFLLLLSSALCLRWSHYAFGILVGMGLYNSVTMVAVAVRAQLGHMAAVPYAFIKLAAYNCAIFVWLAYFFGREPVQDSADSLPANDLASWNQALLELLSK